ncbi:MAG: helix-turn-helix domain-containing protein [Cytophagales bacterium]
MNITILVLENSVMQSIADPQYLFSVANQFLNFAGKPSKFEIELVGSQKEIHLNNGLYTIHTTKLFTEIKKSDLIIIPALFGDIKTALDINKNLMPWIIKQHQQGAEIASLCLGAFFLASTGLLNGKKCSTHWGFHNEFRELFPEVKLVNGSIITEEKGIYTSGGAHSYWNLLLHILEKHTDRATAILASKYFAIDINRESQSTFAMFNGQTKHPDEGIKLIQTYIEQHLQEKMTIDELANMISCGRRSFERRFKKATNNTVLEYINRVKIESAKRNLELSSKNISEIMHEVGYTDTKAFRSIFKKYTGINPLEYKNKYNKISIEHLE